MFCKECEKDNHFLHRTNELYLLFINKGLISVKTKHWYSSLKTALDSMVNLKRNVENSVQHQINFIKRLANTIEGIQRRLKLVTKEWDPSSYDRFEATRKVTIVTV